MMDNNQVAAGAELLYKTFGHMNSNKPIDRHKFEEMIENKCTDVQLAPSKPTHGACPSSSRPAC